MTSAACIEYCLDLETPHGRVFQTFIRVFHFYSALLEDYAVDLKLMVSTPSAFRYGSFSRPAFDFDVGVRDRANRTVSLAHYLHVLDLHVTNLRPLVYHRERLIRSTHLPIDRQPRPRRRVVHLAMSRGRDSLPQAHHTRVVQHRGQRADDPAQRGFFVRRLRELTQRVAAHDFPQSSSCSNR